jgi:hypothetical protein
MGDGLTEGGLLCRHIHHSRLTFFIEMGQFVHGPAVLE